MAIQVGDQLPDVALLDAEDRLLNLKGLAGSSTLLIFLRHLGCLPCREHLMDVLAERERLGVRVVCVTFSPASMLSAFRYEMGLDPQTLLLGDPERLAYRAFGFERGSIGRIWLDPRVWWRYAQLLARGRRLVAVRQDTLQLGGDVLSDAAGKVIWVYRSRGPEDRPSLAAIAAARGQS